jgi:hypothetical protein
VLFFEEVYAHFSLKKSAKRTLAANSLQFLFSFLWRKETKQKKHGCKFFAKNSALRLANLIIHMWELNSPAQGGLEQ